MMMAASERLMFGDTHLGRTFTDKRGHKPQNPKRIVIMDKMRFRAVLNFEFESSELVVALTVST